MVNKRFSYFFADKKSSVVSRLNGHTHSDKFIRINLVVFVLLSLHSRAFICACVLLRVRLIVIPLTAASIAEVDRRATVVRPS